MKNIFLLSVVIFISNLLLAQVTATKENVVVVKDKSGDILTMAWAGGLNAPQFSDIDLNADGIFDLFIFDREGSRILTFLNGGTSGKVDYSYAPEYEAAFPALFEFALLVDYNNDGKNDIFTHDGGGGIKVFKNISTPTELLFTIVTSPSLMTVYNLGIKAPLYSSRLDIPAILDVDNDGDIDILSFDNASTTINFFENYAIDSGTVETFNYHLTTSCWGNFAEDASTNQVTLNKTCPRVKAKSGNKHSGSTLLAFDPDGDGDKDLLLGDVTYPEMNFLENGGTVNLANMVAQTNNYPAGKKIDLYAFPAAFSLDVNNDGLKDLLVAPNTKNNIENRHGVLYYKNTGNATTSVFSYVQNDFLQGEMIETGTGAFPVLFDFNKDGLQDLIVGNRGIYNGAKTQISKLILYKNNGSKSKPVFKLHDENFAGLDTLNLNTSLNVPTLNVVPTFVDLTSDGSKDMIVGDYNGRLHFFTNHPVNEVSHMKINQIDFLDINVGQFANPQLFDIDGDGLQDLLVGNKDGFISYYKNEGQQNNYNFVLKTSKLGNVRTKLPLTYFGYNQPFFFNAEHDVYLLCGSDGGNIYYYNNVRDNLEDGESFNLVDSIYMGIDVGGRSHIAAHDLDNDGLLEFIIGNSAGGLSYFQTDYAIGIENYDVKNNQGFSLKIQNLDNQTIRIIVNDGRPTPNAELFLYNIAGQLLFETPINGIHDLSITNLNNGLYIVSVKKDGFIENEKYIKQQ